MAWLRHLRRTPTPTSNFQRPDVTAADRGREGRQLAGMAGCLPPDREGARGPSLHPVDHTARGVRRSRSAPLVDPRP
jgi:hypothetical protein